MVSQQCLCLDSISACPDITFYYCILFLFLPRWVMSIEIKKRKIEEKMVVCHLLFVQIFHYLLFTLLHSVPPHLLFGYIRFSVIFTSVSWYNFQTLQGTAKWRMLSELYVFSPSPLPAPVAC